VFPLDLAISPAKRMSLVGSNPVSDLFLRLLAGPIIGINVTVPVQDSQTYGNNPNILVGGSEHFFIFPYIGNNHPN